MKEVEYFKEMEELNRLKKENSFLKGKIKEYENQNGHSRLTKRQEKLAEEIKEAIKKKEFEIYYQPIVDLNTGSLVSLEALIRWRRGGVLRKPAEFIPVAEAAGLIVPLGQVVLSLVCSQLKIWRGQGLNDIKVSLNLSPIQIKQSQSFNNILKWINQCPINNSQIEIEITEGSVMENVDQSITKLEKLRDRGVQVSVDDFGIGHSSLNYLRQLPLDKLKIDRAFIQDCPTRSGNTEIVKAIVVLAHNLNLKVVAEGVETPKQLQFLRGIGCDEAQGYLFSLPLEAKKVGTFVTTH